MDRYESKVTPEEENDLSDTEIITFLEKNIENTIALDNFFSNLKSLSANVLLYKIAKGYNLLNYAAMYLPACFTDIVRLATPDAINRALTEIPQEIGESVCLYLILLFGTEHALDKKQAIIMHGGVLSLFLKADKDVLNASLIIKLENNVNFIRALAYPDPAVGLAVLQCASDFTIKEILKEILPGTNPDNSFFHTVIENRIPIEVWCSLLKRLEKIHPKIIDPVSIWAGENIPVLHQLTTALSPQAYIDALLSHLSPATQKIIASHAVFSSKIQFNLLASLIACGASEKTIDTIFSLMGNTLFNELALVVVDSKSSIHLFIIEICIRQATPHFQKGSLLGLQSNATAAIIKHLDKETLIAFMKQPLNLDELPRLLSGFLPAIKQIKSDLAMRDIHETEMVFLDLLSNDSLIFNNYLGKILIGHEVSNLSEKAISCLDEENLGLYLAWHPLLINQSKTTNMGKENKRLTFETRLQKSETSLTNHMAFLCFVRRQLDKASLSAELIKIVISYLGISEAYIKCIEHEVTQETHPVKLLKLTAMYSEISECFLHNLPLIFRSNEAQIVLMYLTKYAQVAETAVRNFHIRKPEGHSGGTEKVGPRILRGIFAFWKEEEPKEKAYKTLRKLEVTKQDIANFVLEQNQLLEEKPENRQTRGSPLRTFEELERYYQQKNNNKLLHRITLLKNNMEMANIHYQQACLELILQDFVHPKKRPWDEAKKLFLPQDLASKVQKYGLNYKVIYENTGFLQAVIQQFAHQNLKNQILTDLASSEAVLYKNMQSYLEANYDRYRSFLDKHESQIRSYVTQNLVVLGEVFDKMIFLTCSRVLNVNIVIITAQSAKPYIFKQPTPVGTLYLGQLSKEYYSLENNNKMHCIDEAAITCEKDTIDTFVAQLHFDSGKISMGNS